jgi:hypothetical protein
MRPHSALVDNIPGIYPESINAALKQYLMILAHVKPDFLECEWNLIFDACNGVLFGEEIENYQSEIILQVGDAITLNQLENKWQCNGDRLLKKLAICNPVECASIVFEIKKFWDNK